MAYALGPRVDIEAILADKAEHGQTALAGQTHRQTRRRAHGGSDGDAANLRLLYQLKTRPA
jgi:hypothetical protein